MADFMNTSKEIVLREDDRIIEYKEKNSEKSLTEYSKSNHVKNKKLNKLSLYQKTMQREEFKRPEPKDIVINEDEYLKCLEEIIQREYYPELYKINREKVIFNFYKQHVLNKLEQTGSVTESRENMNNSVRVNNMERINEEYLAEMQAEKILNNANSDNRSISYSNSNVLNNLNKLNVDTFCMKYASDELESLREIMHKDQKKKLNKYFWMYEQEHQANEKLQAIKNYTDKYLALPLGSGKHFEIPRIITADSDAKNSVFFHPTLSINYKPEEERKINTENQTETGRDFSQNIKSDQEKQILKENTRLPQNFVENMIDKHSSVVRRKLFEAYESSDVVKLMKELNEIENEEEKDKVKTTDTPMINGYRLVKDPKQSKIEKIPIFTWGEVASTPNMLNEGKSGSKFSIPQTPAREDMAHALANKKMQSKKLQKTGQT